MLINADLDFHDKTRISTAAKINQVTATILKSERDYVHGLDCAVNVSLSSLVGRTGFSDEDNERRL